MPNEIPFISAVGRAVRDVPRDIAFISARFTAHHDSVDEIRKLGKTRIETMQYAIRKVATELGVDLSDNKRSDSVPQIQVKYVKPNFGNESKKDGYDFFWGTVLQVPAEVTAKFVDQLTWDLREVPDISIRGTFALSEEQLRKTNEDLYQDAYNDATRQLNERARIIGFEPRMLEIISVKGSDEPSNDGGERGAPRVMAMAAMAPSAGDGGSEPALELEPGTQRVAYTLHVNCRCKQTVSLKT